MKHRIPKQTNHLNPQFSPFAVTVESAGTGACPAFSLAILSAIVDVFFMPLPSTSEESLSTVSVLLVLLDELSVLLDFPICVLMLVLLDPAVVTIGALEIFILAMRSRTDILESWWSNQDSLKGE